MNGSVIPSTPIAVDFWKIRECPQARIFFLTHLHGDHVTGLTSSWNYTIYCSEITGKLLQQRYEVKEDLIHVLQIECAEIIYLDAEHKEQMTVTAIDANHCPGAVMFLMEGYFGTILHTGDFRYHSDMIPQSVLSQYSGKVDVLYLDNTYCSPGCVFPTREEATSRIIDIIKKHTGYDVLIAMRNLGKEELLYKIAMHFHDWISVPDKFYRTLEILGGPDVFDTNSTELRIRVVPFHKVSNKFVAQVNADRQTIVILPTALYRGIEASPYENNDKVFVVPYSDHSSFAELQKFVSYIKPRKIIPIVKGNARGPFGLSLASRADMTVFADFTSSDWTRKVEVPLSVQAFMNRANQRCLKIERKAQKRKCKSQVPQAKKIKRGITYNSPESASKGKHESSNENPEEDPSDRANNSEKENLFDRTNDKLNVKKVLFCSTHDNEDTGSTLKVCREGNVNVETDNDSENEGGRRFERETLLSERRNSATCKQTGIERKNGKNRDTKSFVTESYSNEAAEEIIAMGNNYKEGEKNSLERTSDIQVKKQQYPQQSSDIPVKKRQLYRKIKGAQHVDKKNKSRSILADEDRKVQTYTQLPDLNKIYLQNVAKKTVRPSLLFVSSQQDSRFDDIVGMKTYSKTNSKRVPRVDKARQVGAFAAENRYFRKMNETANWVLVNFQEPELEVLPKDNIDERGNLHVDGSGKVQEVPLAGKLTGFESIYEKLQGNTESKYQEEDMYQYLSNNKGKSDFGTFKSQITGTTPSALSNDIVSKSNRKLNSYSKKSKLEKSKKFLERNSKTGNNVDEIVQNNTKKIKSNEVISEVESADSESSEGRLIIDTDKESQGYQEENMYDYRKSNCGRIKCKSKTTFASSNVQPRKRDQISNSYSEKSKIEKKSNEDLERNSKAGNSFEDTYNMKKEKSNKVINKLNVSDESVYNIAQACTQVRKPQTTQSDKVKMVSSGKHEITSSDDVLVCVHSNESAHEDNPNISKESIIVVNGTQVKKSNKDLKSSDLIGKKSYKLSYSKTKDSNCEEKSYELDPLNEEVQERNRLDDSTIAQEGTQRHPFKRLNDVVRNDSVIIVDNIDDNGSLSDMLEAKSPEKGNKHDNLDNSLSILMAENTQHASKLNDFSDYRSESREKMKQRNIDINNTFENGNFSNITKDKQAIHPEEIEDNTEELNESASINASVFVNVGTQNDFQEVEGKNNVTVNNSTRANVGEAPSDDDHEVCMLFCKQCALDAFNEAFEQLEKSQLKPGSKTLGIKKG